MPLIFVKRSRKLAVGLIKLTCIVLVAEVIDRFDFALENLISRRDRLPTVAFESILVKLP